MKTLELNFQKEVLQQIENLSQKIEQNNLTVLNIDQLVSYTGIPKDTIYKYTRECKIPHSKRGKRLFFDRSAIDAWLLRDSYSNHAL